MINQIFTHGCTFEKGPKKQVLYHFIMEARMCIMEHIVEVSTETQKRKLKIEEEEV